jgi:hypothetical protein
VDLEGAQLPLQPYQTSSMLQEIPFLLDWHSDDFFNGVGIQELSWISHR